MVRAGLWMALCGGSAVALLALATPAAADLWGYPVTDPNGPMKLATAMARGEEFNTLVTGASWVSYPATLTSAAVSNETLGPTFDIPNGFKIGFLSTGQVYEVFEDQNTCPSCTIDANHLPGNVGHGGAFDVTTLAVAIDVPDNHNCLEFKFQFLSEEYPEYVGSSFVDAFVAELDASTWASVNGQFVAPNNFAKTPAGLPITINNVPFAASKAAPSGSDPTVYDGGSGAWAAKTSLAGGDHVVYFTVFDASDPAFDSAVFLDDLRTYWVNNPDIDCAPGISPVPPPPPPPPPPGPPPPPPVPAAKFKAAQGGLCGRNPVRFTDLSTSLNPIVSWDWTFGDGTSSDDRNATHDYTEEGQYVVTLTITDTEGQGSTARKKVNVSGWIECPTEQRAAQGPHAPGAPRDGTDETLASMQSDGDAVPDGEDNCPGIANGDQADADLDGRGDLCDDDDDGDGVPDLADNCVAFANPGQRDMDLDAEGDACDSDRDGDGVLDDDDNCPSTPNPGQADRGGNGLGDACEQTSEILLRGASGPAEPSRDTMATPVFQSAGRSAALGVGVASALVVAAVAIGAVGVLRRSSPTSRSAETRP